MLLLALSLLPYANAPRNGFVFDDHALIEQPLGRPGGVSPLEALTQPYWIVAPNARLWRPVTSMTFAIDWNLGHGSPSFFHVGNLLLHAAATLLLFACVRRIGDRAGPAFAVAALFAVHPLHTEAVTWIAGRAELLAAGFVLSALLLGTATRPRWVWLTPAAAFLAVASKESAATLPLLLLYTRWGMSARRGRPGWGVIASTFGVVILYLLLRRSVLGTWAGPEAPPIDNPMVEMGLWSRLPTVLHVAGRYLSLLIWPQRLSIDYSASVLPIIRGVTTPLLVGASALLLLSGLAVFRRRQLIGWGAGFAVLTFALTSNLPFVIGTIMAERLLYLPSAGLLVVIVAAMADLAERTGPAPPRDRRPVSPLSRPGPAPTRAILLGMLGLAVLLLGLRTWQRNRDYRTDVTLFSAAVKTAPSSPKVRTNLGLWLYKAGRYEEAIVQAREALRLEPKIRDARDVVASSLENLGRPGETISFLKSELAHDPDDQFSRGHLIELLRAAGRTAEADSIRRAAPR